MDVKRGYKQTEVGVIPEEWELTPLVSLGSVIDGDRGSNYPGSKDFNIDGHCLFLNAGNVTKAGFKFGECAFISREKDERLSKGKLKRDDIVLTTRGTVGNFAHFDSTVSYEHIRINSGMVILRNESPDLDSAFLYTLLQSHFVGKQIERLTFGSAQPQLTVKGINEFWIVAPPLPEQLAIATALSDADAWIESLEQLIAKKRQIKQGAMQELLTGKRRLPGFEVKRGYKQTELGVIPEDWEVKYLPKVCRFRSGKAHEQHISDSGRFICVNSKFISTNGVVRKYSTVNVCRAMKNDVLMVMSDLPNGKALAKAFIADADNVYAVNQRVCALTTYNDDPKYLYYILNRNPYFLRFDDGVNQTHLLNNVFQKCLLKIPQSAQEQTAIAAILSDMDTEIVMLETKLSKARQIKQGMMQELLTGRIRLI